MLLSVVAMSPLFLLTLLTGMEERRRAIEDAHMQVRRLAGVVGDEFEKVVEGPRQLFSILNAVPVIRTGTPEARRAFFANLVRENPQYANVGLLSPEGQLLVCAVESEGQVDLSGRAYFRRAIETREFAVGEYHVGPVSLKPGIGFARPMLDDDGTPFAVLFATLDLSWLADLPPAVKLPEGSTLTLWDSRGTVLLRHPAHAQWVGKSGADTEVFRDIGKLGGEGTTEARGLDGIARVYAFRHVVGSHSNAEVTLSIGVPAEVANAPARMLERRNLLILAIATILAASLAAAFGERVVLRLFTSVLSIANTDALTRVASRGKLLADAARELARCLRFRRTLSLLMADIDRFKEVNDRFGHAVGDEVLVEVAKRLSGGLRYLDEVGRYGGEEFVVLLPETGEAGGAEIAERIRLQVAGTPVQTRAGPVEVSVSIGLASVSSGEDTLPGLLARADKALYAAKQGGRNRVAVAAGA